MAQGLPRGAGALFGVAFGLCAAALLFSRGSAYEPLVWIGGAAVLAAGAGLALACWPVLPLARPDRFGIGFFAALVALVLWMGLTIAWSVEPDRSWEYLNRGLVYLAFAVVGLLLASAPRAVERAALGAAALCGLVVAWALAGKVVPDLFPDGERIARLRDPLGYWNALALVAAIGVLLGAWVGSRPWARWLRLGGALLVFFSTVALLLTYSRGGVLVALVVGLVFLVLVEEKLQAAAVLVVGVVPGLAVAAWAFTQDGISADRQPYDTRLEDGLQLGGALALGVVVVTAAAEFLLRYEAARGARLWQPERRHWIGAGAAALVSVLLVVLIASGGHPGRFAEQAFDEFTTPTVSDASTARRFGELSSNSRWDWWVESWDVFRDHPVAGAGAGAWDVARRPYRRNILNVVEPHSLPIQFLAETGLVGLALLLAVFGLGAAACVAAVRCLAGAERTAGLVLALAGLAYLLHALLDYDWDFVGLTGPTLLVVGVLIGVARPPVRAARRPVLAVSAVALALAGVWSLASPWLATRKVESAYAALDEREAGEAVDLAEDAQALNPLAISPLYAEADAQHALGNRQAALDLYVRAVELQPENWRTWYELALYEESIDLIEEARANAGRAYELDPLNPALGPFLEFLFQQQ